MGWKWRDESNETSSSPKPADTDRAETSKFESGDQCLTRRIVKSQCRIQEVEPGKFIRKCEKTEQILKDCIGRPIEVVQSNTKCTEDDITNEMANGSLPFVSSGIELFNCPALRDDIEIEPFNCPGLRSEFEAIERSVFGGLNHFFEAAEEIMNGFFQGFGTPHLYDRESSPSSSRETPIEHPHEKEAPPRGRNEESASSNFAGQARDV